MPGDPLRRTSTRPPEGAGRSTAMPAEAAYRPACLAARSARLAHLLCGSGLARDASGAVFELNRADAIASKPAPTWGCAVSSLCLCLCCSQGNVQTTRMPLFQLGVCGGYVLGGSVVFAAIEQLNSVHIRSMRHGVLRVPPLRRGTFVKQPSVGPPQKYPKRPCPGVRPSLRSGVPRSGPAPWARRDGPSLAQHGSPGIHAGRPTAQNLHSASRRGR